MDALIKPQQNPPHDGKHHISDMVPLATTGTTKWKQLIHRHKEEVSNPLKLRQWCAREVGIYREMRSEAQRLHAFVNQQLHTNKNIERMNKAAQENYWKTPSMRNALSLPPIARHKDHKTDVPIIADHVGKIMSQEAELQDLRKKRQDVEDTENLLCRTARFKATGLTGSRSVPTFDKWRKFHGTNSKQTSWNDWACHKHKIVFWTTRDPLGLRKGYK